MLIVVRVNVVIVFGLCRSNSNRESAVLFDLFDQDKSGLIDDVSLAMNTCPSLVPSSAIIFHVH
jgi:Ca2+-binding EF-hand superfamily protein